MSSVKRGADSGLPKYGRSKSEKYCQLCRNHGLIKGLKRHKCTHDPKCAKRECQAVHEQRFHMAEVTFFKRTMKANQSSKIEGIYEDRMKKHRSVRESKSKHCRNRKLAERFDAIESVVFYEKHREEFHKCGVKESIENNKNMSDEALHYLIGEEVEKWMGMYDGKKNPMEKVENDVIDAIYHCYDQAKKYDFF